jgi:RNase P/RNase MRP subunit p29
MRVALAAMAIVLSSCGYKVAGKADLMPKSIQTIAIPAFSNITTQYKLTDRLPLEIGREFIARTRYRVVADPTEADAILTGSVVNVFAGVTNLDSQTGRASAVQLVCILQIALRERVTGKVLYNQPSMEFRQRYEISTTAEAYFDESTPAFQRLSRDVARTVVSTVLEMF